MVKNLPAMQEAQEMRVQSLGWEKPAGGQSCLENPMNIEAWWAIVHRVAELDTTEANKHVRSWIAAG